MVRLALVGCIGVAERYARIASRLQNACFLAAADEDPALARWTARALGASISTSRLDELVAAHAEAFDAVLIHSANCYHQRDGALAAQTGKHVLVETPLALSAQQAQSLIDDCQEAGVRLMVGQAGRFLPSVRAVKETLASGRLGEPGLLRVHRWEAGPSESCRQLEREAEQEGAGVYGLACEIDLACWLFEDVPDRVFAVDRRESNPPLEFLDYLQLHLGFPNGGMALIDCCWTLPQGESYSSLSMIGSTGATHADDHHNMQLVYRGGSPWARKTGEGDGHLLAQVQEFVRAIEEDREPSIPGSDGRTVNQVVDAAERSLKTRLAIQL